MRKYFYFLLLSTLLHNFSVRIAGAQERKATITGHATDANQDPLAGARVELQPLGQTATQTAWDNLQFSRCRPANTCSRLLI
jgi:hypothetical protein